MVEDRRYTLRKKITLFSVSILLFFLFFLSAELILRILMPDLRYFYHTKGITGGIPYTRNSLGMRDKEFPLKKTTNEYRILCVGDSTTFGLSERLEDTWPKQLEQRLKDINSDVFVINAGAVGRHPHMNLELYRKRFNEIDIDMYIYGFFLNDVVIKTDQLDQEKYVQKARSNWWQKFKFHTMLLRCSINRFYISGFLHYIFSKFDPTSKDSKYITQAYPYQFNAFGITREHRQAWNDTFESIQALNNLLKEKNIRFVIIPIPYRFMISNDPRDNKRKFDVKSFKINPVEKLRNFCKENNILFVESVAALQSVRVQMLQGKIEYDPLYIDITDDFFHPNSYGYKVIADSVYNIIGPMVKVGFQK